MTNRSILPVLLLLSTPLAACSSKATAGSASASASARTTTTSPVAAATGEGQPTKPELVDFTNEKIGYTMKMPKGFTTWTSEDVAAAYSAGDMMIFAQVAQAPAASADDVLAGYITDDKTLDKKVEGDLIVIEGTNPDEPLMVNIYAARKGSKISVRCKALKDDKAVAREICTSVKVTKK